MKAGNGMAKLPITMGSHKARKDRCPKATNDMPHNDVHMDRLTKAQGAEPADEKV